MSCTCGEKYATDGVSRNHYDVTGFCKDGRHDECHGKLLGATSSHWACACICHPEPNFEARTGADQARTTWRKARDKLLRYLQGIQ